MTTLKHYGVKGMKWGVRKTQSQANRRAAGKELKSLKTRKKNKDYNEEIMPGVFAVWNNKALNNAIGRAQKNYNSAAREDVKATIAEGGRFVHNMIMGPVSGYTKLKA